MMQPALTITEKDALAAVRAFLTSILPTGVEVVRAQVNRVPPPRGDDYLVLSPLGQQRLSTNTDAYEDAAFTGSIFGQVLTVDEVAFGVIRRGAPVYGLGVLEGTRIDALLEGQGGPGTYLVDLPQSAPVAPLFAGTATFLNPYILTIQADVHGPRSADLAYTLATLFRDELATASFEEQGFDGAPLFASDPKQVPFVNDQRQFEMRWVVELSVQVNARVVLPQQFAETLSVLLVNVP